MSKLSKEKYLYRLKEREPQNVDVGAPSAQRDKRFKEKPDAKWNKGVVPSGQDHTQLSIQLVKGSEKSLKQ